jgi:hypothetical protein
MLVEVASVVWPEDPTFTVLTDIIVDVSPEFVIEDAELD